VTVVEGGSPEATTHEAIKARFEVVSPPNRSTRGRLGRLSLAHGVV